MHTEFYTAFAALLPVLLLAISIQSSFFLKHIRYRLPTESFLRNLHVATVSVMLLLLSVGEAVTLFALYSKQSAMGWVWYLGFVAVMAAFFIGTDFILTLLKKGKNIGLYLFFVLGIALVILLYLTLFKVL